jgi:hypothetical protein
MTARTRTVVNPIATSWTGAPFKADQLVDQSRMIEQPHATSSE